MIKEIKYTGYAAQPSDYECPDGQLALSLNLINEDGALKAIPQPKTLLNIGGALSLYIHTVNKIRHYIEIKELNKFLYFSWISNGFKESDRFNNIEIENNTLKIAAQETYKQISSIGNVVLISTDKNLHYVWFNTESETYEYLGSSIPDVELTFSLQSEFTKGHRKNVSNLTWDKARHVFSDLDQEESCEVFTDYIPANTLHALKENYIPDFTLEKDQRYTIKLETNGSFFSWALRYGEPSASASTACSGIYGGSKSFVAEYSGPCYINFAFIFQPGTTVNKDEWTIPFEITIHIYKDNSLGDVLAETYIPENTKENIDTIAAVTNEFITQEAIEKNKFIYPFFARYALKLYDGSYANVSEPVLLIPNSQGIPFICIDSQDQQNTGIHSALPYAFLSSLAVKIKDAEQLKKWKSIITGIEIFVSSPAYLINEGFEYNKYQYPFQLLTYESGNFNNMFSISQLKKGITIPEHSRIISFKEELDKALDSSIPMLEYGIIFSPFKANEIIDDLSAKADFYSIASIDNDECVKQSNEYFTLEMKKDTLKNLLQRPRIEEDSISVSEFSNASLYTYNNRLHIFDSSIILQPPHIPYQFSESTTVATIITEVRIHIHTDDGDRIISAHNENIQTNGKILWVAYPNPRAFKMEVLSKIDNIYKYWIIELKSHDFLNIAYAIPSELSTPFTPSYVGPVNQLEPLAQSASYPVNKITTLYISEVNNPFIFKHSTSIGLPGNRIYSLSSAAKALSQGQFGQFPLYAFTTEGVWALEVSATGTYSARQPVTRDIMLENTKPLQMDSAVLFATDRGILLLSGSQTQCISDTINAIKPFDVLQLPGMEKIRSMIGHNADSCLPTTSFPEFISECGLLYDYVHQRVIVYNPNYTYAYVFSLKSKEWGMMYSTIEAGINSYPEALAVDHNGALLNFSSMEGEATKGLFVTRPLKLETPDVLKTMDTVIQRGHFRKGHVQSVLYGSRDLFNWHLIWSSKDHYLRGFRGTPYKYFRVALLCDLSPGESIYGASVQFTPRLTNSPR